MHVLVDPHTIIFITYVKVFLFIALKVPYYTYVASILFVSAYRTNYKYFTYYIRYEFTVANTQNSSSSHLKTRTLTCEELQKYNGNVESPGIRIAQLLYRGRNHTHKKI